MVSNWLFVKMWFLYTTRWFPDEVLYKVVSQPVCAEMTVCGRDWSERLVRFLDHFFLRKYTRKGCIITPSPIPPSPLPPCTMALEPCITQIYVAPEIHLQKYTREGVYNIPPLALAHTMYHGFRAMLLKLHLCVTTD